VHHVELIADEKNVRYVSAFRNISRISYLTELPWSVSECYFFVFFPTVRRIFPF